MAFRRIRLSGWETPLALLGVVVLSYGLWIPWMGLFGNDLPYLWYYHLLGPWGPGEFASIDRPFSAVFYAASTFLLGESIWPYHILLLLFRWLSAVLLWWVLGLVWPEHKRGAAIAALLLAVYPGFRQNPVALEFILHFCVLDLFLLSLGASILAVCQPRRFWLWVFISAAGTASLFWLEYFIGLEILRPIFLWFVTRRQGLRGKQQWRKILEAWTPAVLIVLVFLFWRVFIFSFPTYKPVLLDQLRSSPLNALLNLAKTAAGDLWTAFGRAWLQTLQIPGGRRALLLYLALFSGSFGWVWWFWRRMRRSQPEPAQTDYWGETLLGIGLLAMLAGGFIFWLTGIPLTLAFPWDRTTLALMPGACLALTGLIEMVAAPRYRPVLVAGLVGLAVGMHFINAQEYRAEWQKLQDFTWQLTWRAPQLSPGTLALFDVIPLNRYSDSDLTALLNWTYAPDLHTRQIPYAFFDLTLRMHSSGSLTGLPGLEKNLPVERTHRGLTFTSTTSSTLALTYNPPACLKLLDPQNANLSELPDRLAQVLPMTRLDQVQPAGERAARPPAPFGQEPAHGWCYFFEKADLARQQGKWAQVVRLGEQAQAANLQPAEPDELLPFIEGFAMTGQVQQAQSLTAEAGKANDLHPAICALWQRVGNQSDLNTQQAAMGITTMLGCKTQAKVP